MDTKGIGVIAAVVFLGLAYSSFTDGNKYLALLYLAIALIDIVYAILSDRNKH